MTGVGQMYEPPEHPDVVVSGAGDVDEAVDRLVGALDVTH
jgi:bifunctional enzyme CysN/CysC